LIANAWAALDFWTYEPRHLIVAPLSHGANGLLNILTASGAHHVIRPRFDRSLVLDLIEDLGITDLFLPPTAVYSLLADPSLEQRDLQTLRHIVYAGAPISAEKLREGLTKIGAVFTQFFGQAEAPLTATCLSPADHVDALEHHPHRLSSCGRPTLFTELAALGEQDELLEHGKLGEIGIRGPLAMAGYVGEPPRSAEQWHRTGDVGYVDRDGYVFLVDRKRDVIVSGGFNVFPIEVEQALWSIPEVEDCAVIGLPDEKWGEAVTAFVLLKEGMNSNETQMIAHCRKVVGPVKAPKSIRIVESLPRSPVGKVLKRELRDQFWTSRDRKV
jgi:acyl-CoA synthetase (AMP-forming)/AMP-acid ligase II